jgi:predicted phosphodiesterase
MARHAIIADIHGNYPALRAVLNYILKELKIPLQYIINLGDTIGYYPWTNECTDTVRRLKIQSLKGNHCEASVSGVDIKEYKKTWSVESIPPLVYTRRELEKSPRNKEYLEGLAYIVEDHEKGYSCTHSNPINPLDLEIYLPYYLKPDKTGKPIVEPSLLVDAMTNRILFVAHYHKPSITRFPPDDPDKHEDVDEKDLEKPCPLDDDRKILVNVGSVGQPRDGNSKSCFCVFDEETTTVQFYRVAYDIEETQKKTIEADYGSVTRKLKKDLVNSDIVNEKYGHSIIERGEDWIKIDTSQYLAYRLGRGK